MARRIVTVGDDFTLPSTTKVADANLPARLGDVALSVTIDDQTLEGVRADTPIRAAVANAPILPKPRTARPLVAFTFDDSPTADYTIIRPILEARGVRGTFAVLLSAMGTTEPRWAQLREMVANGHEVVNHSATHVQLDAASDAVLDAEIEGAHATFISRGVTPKGFIPPNNAGSVKIRKRVQKLGYRYMMGGEQGRAGANPQPVVTYSMSRIAMDSNTLLATTQAQIDAAKAGNYLLTYVIHGGTLNSTGQTVLGQTIDYAIAQGVGVVTVSEGLDAVGNVYESGDFAGKAVGAPYTVIDGLGKLHGHQTDKVTDAELVSKVRDQAPVSAGMPSRTIMVNDQALGLSFQKSFTGAAEQTISIPLPNMGQFHMLTVDLTVLSQQFYTNAGIRCVYGAKLFCAVGSGDSIRVQPHAYLTASGFTVAPVVTMVRNATTKVTSLQVVFTPATADGSGILSATIAV